MSTGMIPFHFRVKDGRPVYGVSAFDGMRLRIAPGLYKVYRLSRPWPGSNDYKAALRFEGAAKRALRDSPTPDLNEVDLLIADFPELANVHALPSDSVFELA
ncbi:hypothetical protein [Rhizobacter sp. P5_C2]